MKIKLHVLPPPLHYIFKTEMPANTLNADEQQTTSDAGAGQRKTDTLFIYTLYKSTVKSKVNALLKVFEVTYSIRSCEALTSLALW